APLSGPLHASSCNIESSLGRRQRYSGDLPLERLCAPQQAPHHDADAPGVLAAFSPPRPAPRVSSHPLLRAVCQPAARSAPSALPYAAGHSTAPSADRASQGADPLALPLLSGTDAGCRTTDRQPTSL